MAGLGDLRVQFESSSRRVSEGPGFVETLIDAERDPWTIGIERGTPKLAFGYGHVRNLGLPVGQVHTDKPVLLTIYLNRLTKKTKCRPSDAQRSDGISPQFPRGSHKRTAEEAGDLLTDLKAL